MQYAALQRFARGLVYVAIVTALGGCGAAGVPSSSSGGSSTLVPIELPSVAGTVQDLAMATNPVVVGSSNLMAPLSKSGFATSGSNGGVKLGYFSSTDVTSSMAANACGSANDLRRLVGGAALSDYAICWTKKVLSSANFPSSYYDDEYHIVSLTASGGDPTPRIVKARVKVALNSDGALTSFTMQGCDTPTRQVWHVTQTINPTTKAVAITNMYSATASGDTHQVQVDVEGVLQDANTYVRKSIVLQDKSVSSNSSVGIWTLDQGATTFVYDGRRGGDFTGAFTTGWSYGQGDLIDFNTSTSDYDPNLLAMSDGASRVVNYSSSDPTTQTVNFTQGWRWDGTTLAPYAASPYLAAVAAATPEAGVNVSDVSVSFTGDQAWSCSGTAEIAALSADVDIMDCEKYITMWDGSYVECQSTSYSTQ